MRLQAQEMLKQQVRVISDTVADQTNQPSSSKVNRVAKQILKVLATWSLVHTSSAESTDLSIMKVGMNTEALSLWHAVSTPYVSAMLIGVMFLLGLFLLMAPGGDNATSDESFEEEPEVEQDGEASIEPAPMPRAGRYPINRRSLCNQYPSLFTDPEFRCEGILVWMNYRCQMRMNRGHNAAFYTLKKDTFDEMLMLCADGLEGDDLANMRESILSLTDLSDDEESPRHNVGDQQLHHEIAQCNADYDEAYENRQARARTERYRREALDEVSDPEFWMIVNHDTSDLESTHS